MDAVRIRLRLRTAETYPERSGRQMGHPPEWAARWDTHPSSARWDSQEWVSHLPFFQEWVSHLPFTYLPFSPESREAARRRLEEDLSWYLADGGKVTRIPSGVSGERPLDARRTLSKVVRGRGRRQNGG